MGYAPDRPMGYARGITNLKGANNMGAEDLTADLIELLHLVKEKGQTVCTGACELRHPGELHCFNASQMLHISAQGYKNRLLHLVRMGLLNLRRVKRHDGKVMGQYTLSEEGLKALSKVA
jgi:hypothetical protein